MRTIQQREAIIAKLIEKLRLERTGQGLSLNEVAARAGLSRTMVMRVEKGERLPTIDTLLRITDALGCRLGDLLAEAEQAAESKEPG